MKSILFNLLVVAALVYLLAGGKPPEAIGDGARQVVDATRNLVSTDGIMEAFSSAKRGRTKAVDDGLERAKRNLAPLAATAGKQQRQDVPSRPVGRPTEPRPAPPVATAETSGKANESSIATAPVRPGHEDLNKVIPVTDPAVARRRAEVLGEGVFASPRGSSKSLGFMTSADRRRELNRLAEDMELLFAEKITR